MIVSVVKHNVKQPDVRTGALRREFSKIYLMQVSCYTGIGLEIINGKRFSVNLM